MKKKELEQIKQNLLEQKANLESELSKFAKQNPNNPEDYETQFEDIGDDETDNTSEVAKFGLNLTLEKTLEKSLRDVNKSLARVNGGDYGTCKYCQNEINFKRLMARRTYGACISCKTKLKSL